MHSIFTEDWLERHRTKKESLDLIKLSMDWDRLFIYLFLELDVCSNQYWFDFPEVHPNPLWGNYIHQALVLDFIKFILLKNFGKKLDAFGDNPGPSGHCYHE